MNWFKRLCMFLFGMAGLASLAALSLTWVGPWTRQARSMLELSWYLMGLELLVLVTVVGLLICVLVALFYPRNPKETVVAQVDGGKITVTRHAIVSQVRHLVECDGVCKASSIHVRVRKRGNVRVNVRVKPNGPIDIISYGEQLYARLEKGLAEVCGDSVKSIDVVFAEPSQAGQKDAAQTDTGISVTPPSTGTQQGSSADDISVRPSALVSLFRDEAEDSASEAPTVALDDYAGAQTAYSEGESESDAADQAALEFSWDAADDDSSDVES